MLCFVYMCIVFKFSRHIINTQENLHKKETWDWDTKKIVLSKCSYVDYCWERYCSGVHGTYL